jgi:hypothetical protein
MLYSSPTARFFYTDFAGEGFNPFMVFDGQGQALPVAPIAESPWSAYAFSDSVLVFTTTDEIRFISVPDGSVLRTIARPRSEFAYDPVIKVSARGGRMIFNSRLRDIYIAPDMTIGWDRTSEMTFLDAAFSNDEQYVAILEGRSLRFRVVLLRTETGEELWEENFEHSTRDGRNRWQMLAFQGDFLCVTIPYSTYVVEGILDENTATFVYHLDDISGELLQHSRFSGVIRPVRTATGIRTLTHSPLSRNSIVMKEWSGGTER